MSQYFTIFNYLGAQKKYYGVTLAEIIVVLVVMLVSLVIDQTLLGFLLAIFFLKLIRLVASSSKFLLAKRWGYFELINNKRFYL